MVAPNKPTPPVLGSVSADEVLPLAELRRRFGWSDRAVREARQAGLRLITFGRSKWALGEDVLEFFRGLKDQQAGESAE